MSDPRFEVVQKDAGWHARFISANSRIVWTTEVYQRRRGAERAIELICDSAITVSKFADWPEVRWSVTVLEVRYLDQRYVPPPVVLKAPFWLGESTEYEVDEFRRRTTRRVPFWHDADYHWRFCFGDDDCTQGIPPMGAPVRVRGATGTFTGAPS